MNVSTPLSPFHAVFFAIGVIVVVVALIALLMLTVSVIGELLDWWSSKHFARGYSEARCDVYGAVSREIERFGRLFEGKDVATANLLLGISLSYRKTNSLGGKEWTAIVEGWERDRVSLLGRDEDE